MIDKKFNLYLSIDPGKEFTQDILSFPYIEGIRCNTGAPVDIPIEKVVKSFITHIHPKTPWIDLKGRELRIIKEAIIPRDYLVLNHSIKLETPTQMFYNEGTKFLLIDELIGGNKLKIKPPENFTGSELIKFGKGASINIPDGSLKIKGYFTSNDVNYIKAAKSLGIHNYMLSFVERKEDINALLDIDENANIFLKIESNKGLDFVKKEFQNLNVNTHLIAARADLYIELEHPHEIIEALKLIIKYDSEAIVASHILDSFLNLDDIPRLADFTDIAFLREIGYKNFLLGDEICQNEQILSSALGLFYSL